MIVILGGCLGAEDARPPFNEIQVQLQRAPFSENAIRQRSERVLKRLAHRIAMRGEEKILDQLLRNRRSAPAEFTGFVALLDDLLHLLPIDAVMAVEVSILG